MTEPCSNTAALSAHEARQAALESRYGRIPEPSDEDLAPYFAAIWGKKARWHNWTDFVMDNLTNMQHAEIATAIGAGFDKPEAAARIGSLIIEAAKVSMREQAQGLFEDDAREALSEHAD